MFCVQRIIASGRELFSIRNLSVRNTFRRNSHAIREMKLRFLDSGNLDVFVTESCFPTVGEKCGNPEWGWVNVIQEQSKHRRDLDKCVS